MPKLSRSLLRSGVKAPHGPLEALPVKILQFGEGNFLRGFVDWMLDILNEKGLFKGSVLAVNPTSRGNVDRLLSQDCLYTVLLRGKSEGSLVDERRVVTSIGAALNPYKQWAGLLEAACSQELRFVVSNTTEAGIVYKPEPFKEGSCPDSFPAKCAALLAARCEAFKGDSSKGLAFLPCELIEANGSALKDAILKHLSDWKMDAVASWVSSSCLFANTLVDRIVPGRPVDAEAAKICAELGYDDALLVAGEPFHFWAIEGAERIKDELPFHKAGLNVVWTSDLSPYRNRKVRLLNGAHTANIFGAFLSGVDTVGEMMGHPLFGRVVRKAVFEEILPTVKMDDAERRSFASSVMERFENPFIRHELISISLNSVSKWKVRVLPSLLDGVDAGRGVPPCLAFSLAALLRFYKGSFNAEGAFEGSRAKGPYLVKDDAAALKTFASAWAAGEGSVARTILSDASLWGRDLSTVKGLLEKVEADLKLIMELGPEAAAGRLLL